jgi:hypothetical protein
MRWDVCYFVRAVSATDVESFDSFRRCAVPVAPPPPGSVISYKVEAGVLGNQAHGGELGMDFDVAADIVVTRIGVFDDGSDGLAVPITARIYDRDLANGDGPCRLPARRSRSLDRRQPLQETG